MRNYYIFETNLAALESSSYFQSLLRKALITVPAQCFVIADIEEKDVANFSSRIKAILGLEDKSLQLCFRHNYSDNNPLYHLNGLNKILSKIPSKTCVSLFTTDKKLFSTYKSFLKNKQKSGYIFKVYNIITDSTSTVWN